MRLGTRASELALAQAGEVARAIGECEIVELRTSGDRGAGDDKSRWVDTIELALLEGRIDIAVHSAKDVPGRLAGGLALVAALERAPAADALCGAAALDELASGARVGTSSLRRAAQLRSARDDLEVRELRGNVGTRLAALADPARELDAVVLARAGLERLGLAAAIDGVLDADRFVPAPGQGTIALETRAADDAATAAASAAGSAAALAALHAERAVAGALDADCHTPLGAHARFADGALSLRAWVGLVDGSAWLVDELAGDPAEPEPLGLAVAERLRSAGADALLRRAGEEAP